MRRAPEYRNWAEQVRTLAGEPALACIQQVLLTLAANNLENLDPLNDFVQSHGKSVEGGEIWGASERIEHSLPDYPYGALLASVVVLLLWSTRLDKELYGQMNGMPEPGWAQFPYVCAKAALATNAVDDALRLLERSLDVLKAAKYKDHPRYLAALERYRQLGVEVETRWRSSFEDLANDLRDACRQAQPNFRAEVGALLWTLGMIPESSLFLPAPSSPGLPALRLCRWIITASNTGMERDPLTQYIWLEIKDREPFNIRDHPIFFGNINLRYHNHILDDVMPEPPSRVFAKTLVLWFRGDLDEDRARSYMESYRLVEAEFPSGVSWPIYFRMFLLAEMVAERFGWIKPETPAKDLEIAQRTADQAASVNYNAFLHPDWPELYTRTTGPIFFLIDKAAAAGSSASTILAALERFRVASLHYWLMAAPPQPSATEQAAAAELIEQEKRLLIDLKGAYFLILAPILPMHYRRAAREIKPDDPSSFQYPNTSSGFDHYKRIMAELDSLHAQMQASAPEYARRRITPVPDVASLAGALGMHRNGP